MDNFLNIILLFTAIVIVGGLVIVVMMVTKKGEKHLDVTKYRSAWMRIEQGLQRDQSASYTLAILEGDKLLDQALRERGIQGQTMGERMKTHQARWTNANAVWGAHKMRNQIAHETDFTPSYNDARRALAGFKQGLKDIGAI